MSAERPVVPSATALVMVLFFGLWGLVKARTPLISAPSAGRRTTRSNALGMCFLPGVYPRPRSGRGSPATLAMLKPTGSAGAPEIPGRCAAEDKVVGEQ